MSTPLELAAAIIADSRRVQVYAVTQEPHYCIKRVREYLNRLGYWPDVVRLAVVPETNEICAVIRIEHGAH